MPELRGSFTSSDLKGCRWLPCPGAVVTLRVEQSRLVPAQVHFCQLTAAGLSFDVMMTLVHGDLASGSSSAPHPVTWGLLFEDPGSQCSPLSTFIPVGLSSRGLILLPLVVLPFIRTGHLSLPSGLG